MSNNLPIKGMILDRVPTDVKNTEYTYALNAIFEDFTGNELKLANEHGNELLLKLEGRTILGTINLKRDEIVLFSKDNSLSYIGILRNGEYQDIIKSSCLGFENRIRGEYKVKNGCERIIFFNEEGNSDKLINLDRLDLYITGDNVEDANSLDQWDCNEMRLQPFAKEPIISLDQVLDGGGNIEVGTLAFQIEYLDVSSNIIYRSPLSTTVSIYDENIGSSYDDIDGAFNLEVFQAVDGGVPSTSKSVQLSVSELDTRFSFFRLNILHYKQGDGLTPFAHTVAQRFPIVENTQIIIYSGFNPEAGDFQLDPSELAIKPVIYESSYTLTQVDNRLVRGNLVDEFRDYSDYQRKVNNITIKPVVENIEANNASVPGNAKNPNTYWNYRTYPADEIIALGVEFIFSSGKVSPEFHIPGRKKITGVDDTTIVYNPNNEDFNHLPVKDTYEKWEVYNTGNSSRMGYYEGLTNYPMTKDCEGQFIYGDLAGTPIRHHRVPCRREISLTEGGGTFGEFPTINLIGLEFDEVEYPDDDIIGHRFTTVKRTVNTKTVLDNGYLNGPRAIGVEEEEQAYQFRQLSHGANPNVKAASFISPKSQLRRYQNGSHFKLNSVHQRRLHDQLAPELHGRREYKDDESNAEFEIETIWYDFGFSWKQPANIYKPYTANVFVNKDSLLRTSNFDFNIFNSSYSQGINVYNLVSPVTPSDFELIYATNKRYLRPYENLEALSYYAMHPGYFTDPNTPTTVFGGDMFVSEMRLVNIYDIDREGGLEGGLFEKDYKIKAEYLFGLYVESEINADLFHAGTGENSKFIGTTPVIHPYIITKIADQQDNNEWVFKGASGVEPETYLYNPDYSVVQGQTENFPLPNSFNYCSKCRNRYPNRLTWSEKDFDELDTEGYKIFKSENATTVGATTGAITALHYDKNRMLVRTEQSMFRMAPTPQEIQTDIESAYLGTGDFLSIPPREMVKTNYGYGGGKGRFDYTNSEYGFLTVDQDAGQVFLFSGNSVKELTSREYGISRWMSENLPTNVDYINCVFDPDYNRFLLFKKGTEDRFSWTLSFGFDQNGWSSFHSYLPDFAFSDLDNLYTVKSDEIYKSSKLNTTTYFGDKYDYVIEYVVASPITVDLDCIHYYAQTLSRDEDNKVWIDVDSPTFDRMLVYTNQQSTGLQRLTFLNKQNTPWGNRIGWSNTQKDIIHAEQNYRICAIKDLANGYPVVTSKWELIEEHYPIDKISNDGQIDYNRNQWKLINMKDKFFKIRLYFNPDGDYKIILNLTESILTQSEL